MFLLCTGVLGASDSWAAPDLPAKPNIIFILPDRLVYSDGVGPQSRVTVALDDNDEVAIPPGDPGPLPPLWYTTTSSNLDILWPRSHVGWLLECRTNTGGAGLGGSWTAIPGSSEGNQMTVPMDPANPPVVFRLRSP